MFHIGSCRPALAKFPPDVLHSEGEDISEMGSAVLAAQACGAQVLLGDRDFEVRQPRISQQPVQVRMVASPSTLVARVDNDQVVYVGVKRQETKRRLVAAGLVEDVDDERLDDPEALLHDSMSRSDKKVLARLRLRVCFNMTWLWLCGMNIDRVKDCMQNDYFSSSER